MADPRLHSAVVCAGVSLFVLLVYGVTAAGGEDVYVVYANGATSERNLPICGSPRMACNIVQKRFWLSPMVKRLCKCHDTTECPQTWGEDKYTISLNSRAQLKFCGQVGNLPNCTATEIAMVTESHIDSSGQLIQAAKVNCFCPKLHYFERSFSNVSSNAEGNVVRKEFHKCSHLQSCSEGDFCGYITTTFYETYYICTCPLQNICIMESRQSYHVLQPLYEGAAYRGVCTPYHP